MARQLRIEYPGATYHVMSRGVARMKTFVDDQDRLRFLELVAEPVESGALIVHAYCLMPNHYHLLVETPEAQLGRWMHRILGVYAGGFNRRHKRVGHLWQGRYRAILVEDGEYFLECSRYIHLNPSRSGITRSPELYRWSSYRNYIGGQTEVDWVTTERTWSHFNARKDYRSFVEFGRGEEPISPFERARAGLVLGSEAFLEKIRTLTLSQETGPDIEVPSLRRLRRAQTQSADTVRAAVSRIFSEYSPCQRKRMFVYALRRLTWLRSCQIADLAGRTPGAVTHAVKSIERRLKKDAELAAHFQELYSAPEMKPEK